MVGEELVTEEVVVPAVEVKVEVEAGVEDEEEEHREISGEDSGPLRPTPWRNKRNSQESRMKNTQDWLRKQRIFLSRAG